MSLTPKSKNLLVVLTAILIVVGGFFAWKNGLFDNTKTSASTMVGKIELPKAPMSGTITKVEALPLPTKEPSKLVASAKVFRQGQMQWESQFAWLYANGGPATTTGSLMEWAGVNLQITRQDDCMAGIGEIVKCATAYKNDPNTTEGFHMYNVMFDGSGAFIKNLETQLKPLGNNYRPVILPYFAGKSYGADAVWVPRSWVKVKSDGSFDVIKDSLKGCVLAMVAKDGDWNVAVNLASINQIPFNWDIGTYDPNAMNVFNVSKYTEAAAPAIANDGQGLVTTLKLKKGKGVAGTVDVRVRGFSSWSPEDKKATDVGGFVRVLSTKEYDSQMTCATITFKQFVEDNHDELVKMILALGQAADQINSNPAALRKAAEIASEVYGGADSKYFIDMYNGDIITDGSGHKVEVGGNRVMNIADNMEYFGMSEGSNINVASRIYKIYADIIATHYPGDMPGGPVPFSKVVDQSLLQDAYDSSKVVGQFISKPALADFSQSEGKSSNMIGSANYQINFETGKATLQPGAETTLNDILNIGLSGSNTRLEINGYTDNVGNPTSNKDLSERRAATVFAWLRKQAPERFTQSRVKIQGFGQDRPIANNNTESGKAQNRRVEIIIKSN